MRRRAAVLGFLGAVWALSQGCGGDPGEPIEPASDATPARDGALTDTTISDASADGASDTAITDGSRDTAIDKDVSTVDAGGDASLDCAAAGGWNTGGPTCCFNTTTCTNDLTDCGKKKASNCAAYGAPPIACEACDCADYGFPHGAGEACSTAPNNDPAPGLVCGCGKGTNCLTTRSPADAPGTGKCCPDGQELNNGDVCATRKTCADFPGVATKVNGATDLGKKCSDFLYYFETGPGFPKVSCKCAVSGGYENELCTGDGNGGSPGEGQCTCAKTECDCTNDGQPDGCGGTIQCCPKGGTCKVFGGNNVVCVP